MSWIRQTRVAGGRGPLGYRPANKEDSRGLAKLLHASPDKEQELKASEEKIVNFYWKKNRGCACQEEGNEVVSAYSAPPFQDKAAFF